MEAKCDPLSDAENHQEEASSSSSAMEDLDMVVENIKPEAMVKDEIMSQSSTSASTENIKEFEELSNKTKSPAKVSAKLEILLTTPPYLPDKKRNSYTGPKKALTLGERMRVIRLNEEGQSTRQIAKLLGVGRTQIQLTLKRKQEYIQSYNQNAPLEQRRQMRKTGNECVNELCWKWYQEMSRRNIKINGPMLKERALNFAAESGNSNFKASNGWLDSFLKRHNIVFGKPSNSMESNIADASVVTDWKKKVKILCEGYEERNIFNLDEAGLFYRITSDKGFYTKGQQCPTGQKAEDRLTIMMCTNMTGERETALVIGNLSLSRSLTDVNYQQLPVTFKLASYSWMNADLFTSWLTGFNNKMALQQRQIILFLDNALCHQYIQLSNIKLQYLPPNISSMLQPLHQGVIQDFKRSFRRKQISFLVGEMEAHPLVSAKELMKKSDVIDSLYWVASAWNDVPHGAIQKCFLKCGFGRISDVSRVVDSVSKNDLLTPPDFDRVCSELIGGTFFDMCVIDEELATCNMSHWGQNDYVSVFNTDQDRSSEVETMEEAYINRKPSFAQANDAVKTLCKFAQSQGLNQIVDQVFLIQESIVLAKCNQRQKTIDEFLKSYI